MALLAFAGNSVLCRLALSEAAIDPAGFTLIRLFSGAIMLVLLSGFGRSNTSVCSSGIFKPNGPWLPAVMLFVYALTFSLAYVHLQTGTGALILFAAVQLTLIAGSLIRGHRITWLELGGLCLAMLGLVVLVAHDLSLPTLTGLLLMGLSGIAWGIYTLNGQNTGSPLQVTTINFVRTLPLILMALLPSLPTLNLSSRGVLLAILSGAITSGLGYALWYRALQQLTLTEAGVLQLSVPLIASAGGVWLAHEPLTSTLVFSSLLILGGILLVILSRQTAANRYNEDSPTHSGGG
ncbi:MAG: DMT family transporter [Gammaproteobacteria bacterium]|nr:MAG: DMT family transporter [Gammaproteobacteria bacterium]